MYIEICGGIASGKTTFASLMSEINITPLFENFEKNPFWQDFYLNPGKYIFETEVTFLLQHYNQIKKRIIKEEEVIICDFSPLLDLAYAEVGLEGSKLKAFYSIYNEVKSELPPPALIVYLDCDVEIALDRIKKRSRDVESSINVDFLKNLNNCLKSQLNDWGGKILTIDSSKNDFANNISTREEMKQIILSQIESLPG